MEMLEKCFEETNKQKIPIVYSEDRELKEMVVTKDMATSPEPPRRGLMSSLLGFRRTSVPPKRVLDNTVEEINMTHGFRERGVLMEGWLTKQKGKSAAWDRKYFILHGEELEYFTPKIKGNLPLDEKCTVERVEEKIENADDERVADNLALDKSFLNFRIRIRSPKKIILMAAANQADLDSWIAGFNSRTGKGGKNDHLEGWLMKQDPTTRAWRRRYFILYKERCWYYEMVPKGIIDLVNGVSGHAMNVVAPTETLLSNTAGFAGQVSKTKFSYRWNVTDAERIFNLAADSEDEMNLWIEAVERASREFTKGGGGGTLPELSAELAFAITQEAPVGEVAFVFTDVQRSTDLWERLPDAMEAVPILLAVAALAGGCKNTLHGAGEDIERGGEKIQQNTR